MTKKVCLLAILVFCVSISSIYANEKTIEKSVTLQNNFPNIFRPIGDLVKRIFGIKVIKKGCELPKNIVDVTDIILSQTEFSEQSLSENKQITVLTKIYNPMEDTVVYDYQISAGRIIGYGSKIIWDLSNAKAGTYTITARVDGGCGFCGKSMTKTITIKP